jgi:hypothetical protein
MKAKTVTFYNLSEVLKAVGYSDLQKRDDFLMYFDWVSWGDSLYTIVTPWAVLDSIVNLLEADEDQTFSVDQHKSLDTKFQMLFEGTNNLINMEG